MRLLILDRDGVINEERDDFIKSVDEWQPIPGSLEAIARASLAGYKIIVISNQSGLARGLFDIEALNRIHKHLHKRVGEAGGRIDAIFFCPHGPDDGCQCRKPKPGLLVDIKKRLNIDLKDVPVVGDRLTDIQAAKQVGAQPILVKTGRGQKTLDTGIELDDVAIYDDLAVFTNDLLKKTTNQ